MDASFWHNRWQTNQAGWHEQAVNPLLIAHFPSLNVPPGGRVFVPLCGKSLDLSWLLSHGYAVAGAELSELAVTQLFTELGMEARISAVSMFKLFRGEKIDIFVGDRVGRPSGGHAATVHSASHGHHRDSAPTRHRLSI